MINAFIIAFLSIYDIITKGHTVPLAWWEITIVAVELSVEVCLFIYNKYKSREQVDTSYIEYKSVQEEIEVDYDEDYKFPIVMRPTTIEEIHSDKASKTIESLNAEWDKVYSYLVQLQDERGKATRFGKQLELDRKIESCNIQLEFIESRLRKLGVM